MVTLSLSCVHEGPKHDAVAASVAGESDAEIERKLALVHADQTVLSDLASDASWGAVYAIPESWADPAVRDQHIEWMDYGAGVGDWVPEGHVPSDSTPWGWKFDEIPHAEVTMTGRLNSDWIKQVNKFYANHTSYLTAAYQDEEILPLPKDPFTPGESEDYLYFLCDKWSEFFVASVGPDGVRDLVPTREIVSSGVVPPDLIYDPTNGLRSRGDIICDRMMGWHREWDAREGSHFTGSKQNMMVKCTLHRNYVRWRARTAEKSERD